MNSVCIFLGSSSGNHPAYIAAAREMGHELAVRGLTCIYGGSRTGLMNQLADSALAAGGKVIGVTVQALKDKENFHQRLAELHVLPTMHERKNLMMQLADGFVALPGGIGTLEEFLEAYTLGQMGFHTKPCGLLNVNGFYTPLEMMLETAEKEGFLKKPYHQSILCAESSVAMLDLLQHAAEKR
ncbi:TIGR00730 family Rossman fold protein [Desulfopila sp. IMCC35006]|uniref:LOG family protein n=1 Tax=Desulfopila sp. IMCC35006 TaxID=2569542 RepID=UPI0010AC312D|nr:TIGR00730 family Rossman fold protein [Desulfopila sp. IMCC35006]TKB24010.1 TIGR00730 family Rossman fold protein [Desulfopila sp. IMCC35006]